MQTVTLRDEPSGASAEILVGLGFNCFRYTTRHNGQTIDWLWADPDFASGQQRPSRSGIPLLFPYPGRVAGAAFDWQGKHYQLEATDGLGNATHGFVHTRPWRVLEQTANRVVGQFQASVDDPAVLEHWPADFRITATYALAAASLKLRLAIENPSSSPLPFSLGAHPYFRVPQGGPAADDCVVRLPLSEQWELQEMLPTGRKLPLADADAFAAGRPFGQLQLDDPYSGLARANGRVTASVADPATGHQLTLIFDEAFRECVVFTPPTRQAICIEPYTAAPNAIQLNQRGVDAGLRVLAPGESFSTWMELVTQ